MSYTANYLKRAIQSQVRRQAGGLPKHAVAGGLATAEGLAGDKHAHPQIHGGPEKAVLVVAAEAIEALKERGYPLFYGALGENLTTLGLDLQALRIGDELRAGEARLRITRPRGPCRQLDVYGEALKEEIYDARVKARDFTSPLWGMSGLYAAVVGEGEVRAGDAIEVLMSR